MNSHPKFTDFSANLDIEDRSDHRSDEKCPYSEKDAIINIHESEPIKDNHSEDDCPAATSKGQICREKFLKASDPDLDDIRHG